MRSFLLLPFLFLAFSLPAHATPSAAADPLDPQVIREEFDSLFAAAPVYQAIRRNLPASYEDFFQSYLEAKRSGREISSGTFINAIRNRYLKQASAETILRFFHYTVDVGKDILARNPDAAFSYIFGGDPAIYLPYIDLDREQDALGQLYEQILSTRAEINLQALDAGQAKEGMDYVNALLYLKYGDDFFLLKKDSGTLSDPERCRVCTIYLDIFNEVFQLAPPTRDNVLRSFTARM